MSGGGGFGSFMGGGGSSYDLQSSSSAGAGDQTFGGGTRVSGISAGDFFSDGWRPSHIEIGIAAVALVVIVLAVTRPGRKG